MTSRNFITSHWIQAKLGDVCFTTSGGTPSRKVSEYYEGNMPWVKSGELNHNIIRDTEEHISEEAVKNSSAKIFPEGTLLIALYGATIGKLAVLGVPATTNQAVCGIFKNGIFETKFLFNFLFHKKQKLIGQGAGGAQPNISQTILKRLPVPILPLPEQRAIVAKIEQLFSELDNGITNLQAAKDKLEIYRQAVLKKAFEGALTKEWREKQTDLPTADELLEQIKEERIKHYENQLKGWEEAIAKWEANGKQEKKPSKPSKVNSNLKLDQHESQQLIDLPEKYWTFINIDFASSKLGDGLHGTPNYSDGDYYFINGNNLQDGKIVFKHDTKRVSREEALKHYRELTNRTVLVSINGTLGNIAFYNNEKVMLGKSACYFNLLTPVNKSFIRWVIASHEFRNYAFKTATGTTIKNVPLKAMRNFIFPLCSEKEQSQIVQEIETRLSVCDNILANIEEGLEKSEALRQSILKQAFEGKLLSEEELEACRQEPDWEPAEQLLERIKNEKLVEA